MKIWIELPRYQKIVIKTILLAVLLLCFRCINFVGLTLNQTVISNPFGFLLISLTDVIVLTSLVLNARMSGWRLMVAIFLVYYGLSSFLVGVEAYYLSDLLTPEITRNIFINGATVAGVSAYLAVVLHRGTLERHHQEASGNLNRRPWWSWLLRLCLSGLAYLLIYIFAGILIFQPLATTLEPIVGPEYIANFQPEDPAMVLGFQTLRGMAWSLLTVPMLYALNVKRWQRGLIIGLTYAFLMAPLNLIPNEIPSGIRMAHAVEVFAGNFTFGWVVVYLLNPPDKRECIEKQKARI